MSCSARPGRPGPGPKALRPLFPIPGLVLGLALLLAGCSSPRTATPTPVTAIATPGVVSAGPASVTPGTNPVPDPPTLALWNARVNKLLSEPLTSESAVAIAVLRNHTLTRLFDQLGLTNERLRMLYVPDPRHDGGVPLGGETRLELPSTTNFMSWLSGAALADGETAVRQSAAADQAGAVMFDVRRAWVDAVGAAERFDAEADAVAAAEALRDIVEQQARIGSASRLAALQARQAWSQAIVQQARLRIAAQVARERLDASMGLFFKDADTVKLPRRLPVLPEQPVPQDLLELRSLSQRIDVIAARLAVALPGGTPAATAGLVATAPDGHVHALEYPEEAGMRARMEVRSTWAAYTAAHEIAVHAQAVDLPLAEAISAEQLLRYNGMLIGVDALLADAQRRSAAGAAAIDARRGFWRADVDLQQAMAGTGHIEINP